MIIIATLASLAGIAVLCWLLFNLAVLALPLFAGVVVGTWALRPAPGFPAPSLSGPSWRP